MMFLRPNIEKLRYKNNIKGLIKALSHKVASIRLDAVHALSGKFEDYRDSREKDEATMAIEKMLDDPDALIREQAVYAIANMRQRDPLIKVLQTAETPLRIVAARAAGRNVHDGYLRDALVEALLKDNEEEVRANAAISLGDIIDYHQCQFEKNRDSIDKRVVNQYCNVLQKSLGDTPVVRSNVLWALGKSKKAGIIPHLINGLGDENEKVRENAAVALGMTGPVMGSEGIDALLNVIQNSDESSEVRKTAIRSLGSAQNEIAARAFMSLKESPVADEFEESFNYAVSKLPSYRLSSTKQQEQKGLYWAYIHRHGKILVKEWYEGNTYLQEAASSEYVKKFLQEPFEAASVEEAEEIADKLLNSE